MNIDSKLLNERTKELSMFIEWQVKQTTDSFVPLNTTFLETRGVQVPQLGTVE